MLSWFKWPMSVTGARVGESCPGVRGGGMASLARQRHRDAMEETGAVGVGSQLGPEDTRHSLVSQGSLGNVLEGPAQNALERAVGCSISSLVLLKQRQLAALTELLFCPVQRASGVGWIVHCRKHRLPSAWMARQGRGGGLNLGLRLVLPVVRKTLPWPFREPGDRQGPEPRSPLAPGALTYLHWAELWGARSLREGHCVPTQRSLRLLSVVLNLWLLCHLSADVETGS